MSVLRCLILAAPAAAGLASASTANFGADHTEYAQLQALGKASHDTALGALASNSTCNAGNVVVRRSWHVFKRQERLDYIKAVKCLQSAESITPTELGSGIKTRFDDFVATHMNQTNDIHLTGNFLSWHRYFIWLYEKALQEECGYEGTLPYWDWPLTAITGLEESPIYDGSDTSMSGNGEYIPNQPDLWSMGVTIPAGTGGGCVFSGPFANMTVNLGPVNLALPGNTSTANPHNDTGILSWNPRCLKRDLTDFIIQKYNSATQVLDTILLWDTISDFQLSLQGINITTGANYFGPHGGGHWSMGGDPGRDLFASPADPTFYLHHTMIDRVWWMWQMQSPAARTSGPTAVGGTITFLNDPPSRDASLDDYNNYGFAAGPPRQIGELVSTTAGPFCYVYE
ncbi:hypothetical protein KVR01_010429 [Diaporthe batatas]|uniref:uncharacterized protein n=1 Tax=Diaporthe batatas TaxID=748121 RepID=UPI001D056896|nr:uncharacterized protein KVR01_010429 [Diaporthe batatas]KAG8159792.1 hypothetical protein KVR01_010429 [Diaporthe batatas]